MEKAWLLFQRDRHPEALEEAQRALAQDPDDPQAHALAALCHAELGHHAEALASARRAVSLAPDDAFGQRVLAIALNAAERPDEALAAIREAIRLDPEDAGLFAFEASLHAEGSRWKQALESAARGLELEPEHVGCLNVRSMALTRLGRVGEAHAEIDEVLRRAPESSLGHANRGWACLQRREVGEAIEHFTEALRLDPQNGWARSGLIEALKARNLLYRAILSWYLFSARFSQRGRVALIVGLFVAYRVLRAAVGAWSKPLAFGLMAAYFAFTYLSWVGDALFNLLLLADRRCRHILDAEDRLSGRLLGVCYVLAVALLALGYAAGEPVAAWVGFGAACVLAIPVAGVFSVPKGWPRKVEAVIAGALALGAVAGSLAAALGPPAWQARGMGLLIASIVGSMLNTWLVTVLGQVRVAKSRR